MSADELYKRARTSLAVMEAIQERAFAEFTDTTVEVGGHALPVGQCIEWVFSAANKETDLSEISSAIHQRFRVFLGNVSDDDRDDLLLELMHFAWQCIEVQRQKRTRDEIQNSCPDLWE